MLLLFGGAGSGSRCLLVCGRGWRCSQGARCVPAVLIILIIIIMIHLPTTFPVIIIICYFVLNNSDFVDMTIIVV